MAAVTLVRDRAQAAAAQTGRILATARDSELARLDSAVLQGHRRHWHGESCGRVGHAGAAGPGHAGPHWHAGKRRRA
jgi:hypothetical protein